MSMEHDSEAIQLLEDLVSLMGVLRLVRGLVQCDGTGFEGINCGFDEQRPCMEISAWWGEDESAQMFCVSGHRIAPLLERWVLQEVREDMGLATRTRSLAIEYLPKVFGAFGCETRDFYAELDRGTDELHTLGLSPEEVFPLKASKDPVVRTFYRVFLEELMSLLPNLTRHEAWSTRSLEIIPHIQNGSVVEVELRTDIHPLHTETRIAPDAFCNRLFAHLCEVIAYYRVRADEAQQVLDTTLPQLIEKMKSRGVW